MSDRDLLAYWPHAEDVIACIKTDAESASEAVSLAVHQPMRFVSHVIGAPVSGSAECDERELLSAFLTDNLPDGRVIIPIVGQSGVGKSHVIRWLDTQLCARSDAATRVVIRIPKGASLREVLRILLDELRSEKYAPYREELTRAQHELDAREASGLLCEMLAHTLEEMGRVARERRIQKPDDAEAKEREAYCTPEMLPSLLRNQYLRNRHFITSRDGGNGPVKRLVEHLTMPREAGAEDDRKHGFVADDLDFGDLASDDVLGRHERSALSRLDRPERRKAAARVLNLAIDDAKQRLLRIGPSTILDLFDAVRRDLLVDGKELVLLVEDFAVLSGLQKQLLQAAIKEAIRDGRQQLCTMRTALAYTTGYLADTVLTRAHVEYRIPDESTSEDDIFDRVERLVGAYLNAARLGQQELERAYASREMTAETKSRGWIPRLAAAVEPEARATLNEFGVSTDGYELFPLNRQALRQLAREGCVAQNGALVYNPRFVIQNVLNAVLVHRPLFEEHRFPPTAFGSRSTQVGASVAAHVSRRVSDGELDRHLRFLAYWAGVGGAGEVSRRIIDAFHLTPAAVPGLRDEGSATHPASTPPPQSARPPPTRTSDATRTESESAPRADVSPVEVRWDGLLEEWRRGTPLGQRDADQVRKYAFDAVRSAIEWDWSLHRPKLWADSKWADKQRERLFLPRAAGGEGRSASESIGVICTEQDLLTEASSARVKQALMALVRLYAVHKESWDYDGVEEDIAACGALVERLSTGVRKHVQESYFGTPWDPGPLLVQGLLIGARVLGLEKADRDDIGDLANAIFSPSPMAERGELAPGSGWREYLDALARCRRSADADGRSRATWTDFLLDGIGARQGGAATVHAIDAGRLKTLIEETIANWSHIAPPPRAHVAGVADLDALKILHSELRRMSSAVDKERDALTAWRGRATQWLGDAFEKGEALRVMKETIEAAHDTGLAKSVGVRDLSARVEEFRGAPVKAALDDAARLNACNRGTLLSVLSRPYSVVLQVTDKLIAAYDEFERVVLEEMASAAVTHGADPISESIHALRAELVEAKRALGGLPDGDT